MPQKIQPPLHIRQRLSDLQKRLRRAGKADAQLITNHRDVRYLTGFAGDDSWLIIKGRGSKITLISDSRFAQQIKKETPYITAVIRQGSMIDELVSILKKEKIATLALQPNHVTLSLRQALAKKLGAKTLIAADDGLLTQRAVKQDIEIKSIRRALSIQQRAFKKTLEFLTLGVTEQQIAAYLEFQMRRLGADGRSFPTIVAIDENAALPHAIPGTKKLKKGSSILIDFGAKFNGYCSDLTRVVALGQMSEPIQKIYSVVLEAQQKAIKAVKPGANFKEVDQVARDVITKAGYGQYFGHSLGHGIGLDIHEQPVLAPRAKGVLEVGQVVTIEPGIYLPGQGGVRIEDDVLVTKQGGKVLSSLPKSLKSAII